MSHGQWICKTCSKPFARKGDLTRHELLHTGIKPHVCETCGKGFAQLSGLKTHHNVHTGAKPFVCGIGTCKKAFGDPSSRTRHRRETHRREGAYKCIVPDCGKRIKRRSAFMAHLLKHGLDPGSLDPATIGSQSDERGVSATPSVDLTSPDIKNRSEFCTGSRSASLPFLDDNVGHYYSSDDSKRESHCAESNKWATWSSADDMDALLLGAAFDHVMNGGPQLGLPNDFYANQPGITENPYYFDEIFSATGGHSFFANSPLNLPVFDPLLECGGDGFQSSSSSPSSTYSALYMTDFDEDVASSSLANFDNASQELLLYSTI